MFIEVRSEYERGKLLFKWDPQSNIISVVYRDTLYNVRLSTEKLKCKYEIIDKKPK